MTDPEAFDVVIIGGGINGAGLFRDLCEQGVKCLILDKGDWGGGTSAAPSRLIHGGLKYLETGEFRLVAESTLERNLLLRNAPHLVHPLETVIPIQSWMRGTFAALRTFFGSKTAPRCRGAVLIKIGLWLYDIYGAKARVMPRHAMLSRARALRELPALTPRIKAAGTYHDAAITAPERLVLELVQDGLAANPDARALNWADMAMAQGGTLRIAAEGATHHIRPVLVVNAAGPWIDGVNATLGLETRLIGGTRGSHILLDHPDLLAQLNGRMIYFESDDGRVLLVFPYHGRALVGSTDIPDAQPDTAACTPAETDYFITALRALLPGLSFGAEQIVYRYSGIRPLPNSQGVAPGLISRDHSAPVFEAAPDRPFAIISLVGGKWTTFRGFAEQVADMVLARLNVQRHISTRALPIGGGRDMPADRAPWVAAVAAETGLPAERVAELLDRYGTTARAVATHEAPGSAPLPGAPDHSTAEIDWIAHHEQVRHFEDVVLRRTQLAITGRLTRAGLERMADVTAAALGWDTARRDDEVARVVAILAARHGVTLQSVSGNT